MKLKIYWIKENRIEFIEKVLFIQYEYQFWNEKSYWLHIELEDKPSYSINFKPSELKFTIIE